MSEIIVDARGQLCPKPLILTKQALKENLVGTEITVLVDNETSCQNVERFVRDNGMTPHISADGSEFILRFVKHAPELAAPAAEAYCLPASGAAGVNYVVALSADTIGSNEGSDAALGRVLMQGLLATLEAIEPPPTHLILYSRAVLLAVNGAATLPALQALAQRGIAILLCGTCVDHYEMKQAVRVGEIANMLKLLEIQLAAGKVLKP
ncbi:MAG: sulfurtransferase-like selenium metabolism protein YedF [Pseudomonadota bacterium]|jgi:selenium metabolism protein YedF